MKRMISLLMTLTLILAMPVQAASKYTWSESVAPNYIKKTGKAQVSSKPKKGVIKYSKLDSLGRTRRVVGNITYKMVEESAGWRQTIPENANPSGWPEKNVIIKIKLYNGKVYRGYATNRSHLIADSLGGKAIRRNLITGTRMQNVGANDGKGGMAYTERKAVSWLTNHKKGTVYYSATPVYKGEELIPRSVIVDVRSSDKTIDERVIVYNAAKGYKVNYYKGALTATGKDSDSSDTEAEKKTSYVANTNIKKFHLPDCSSVGSMAEKNKQVYNNVTISQMKGYGYKPCQNCLKGR